MPVVPPMAEVKLLRSMQEEIAVLTREAEKGTDSKAIDDAASLQGDLAKHGETLLKKLMERRPQGQRPAEGAEGGAEGEKEGGEPKGEPENPEEGKEQYVVAGARRRLTSLVSESKTT